MKARRLEEALDESLSAYLDGRRTIEESLSLYPALRDQLEPLLKTVCDIARSFDESSPPAYLQERVRHRFLSSASIRRRARAITKNRGFSHPRAGPGWRRRRWAILAIAFIAAITAAAVGETILDTSSDGSRREVQVTPAVAPAVSDLRHAHQQLWTQANQGADVSPEMIRALARTTTELESQVEDFSALDGRSRLELERTIADQYLLLHLIVDTQGAAVVPEAVEALGLTEEIAAEWGLDLPDLPAGGTAAPSSPSPVPSPGHTASPTTSADATDAPTYTPPAQVTPTPPAP